MPCLNIAFFAPHLHRHHCLLPSSGNNDFSRRYPFEFSHFSPPSATSRISKHLISFLLQFRWVGGRSGGNLIVDYCSFIFFNSHFIHVFLMFLFAFAPAGWRSLRRALHTEFTNFACIPMKAHDFEMLNRKRKRLHYLLPYQIRNVLLIHN